MEYHKYSLAKKGKSICPKCEQKTFVLYIDNETSNLLHSTVGKCDRADNCGHHYTPKEYFINNNIPFDGKKEFTPYPIPMPKPQPSFIDNELLKQSLTGYERNNFIQWLGAIAGNEQTNKAISSYFIGTSKHWENSTVFWQIDLQGRIRTGKIMQYDNLTGKRIKEPFNKIGWVHTVLKLDNFNLSQCFFGEHLLKDKNKIVAIVESEKTAIIASIYLPEFIWLACGGCEGLNIDKCRILTGRKVVLFPDAGKFDKWNDKAKELQSFCSVSVSNLIKEQAIENERKNGYDLADYLLKYDYNRFQSKAEVEIIDNNTTNNNTVTASSEEVKSEFSECLEKEKANDPKNLIKSYIENPTKLYIQNLKKTEIENWNNDISELEQYFSNTGIPPRSVKIDQCTTIENIELFVKSHLEIVKHNNGKEVFKPYLMRLKQLKTALCIT